MCRCLHRGGMSVGDRALRGSICGVIVRPSLESILVSVEVVVLMVLVVLLSVALVIVVTITFLAVMV